jgi:hypothetical protein
LAALDSAACAVDLQLQTPFGAVALREWAGSSRRVLLKTASGAAPGHRSLAGHAMSSLLVFPGQGAQHGHAPALPADVLAEASDVLGEDVRRLDSAQALASTRAVQLCLLIAGVAHASCNAPGLRRRPVHRRVPGSGGRRGPDFAMRASGQPARRVDAAGLSTGLRHDRDHRSAVIQRRSAAGEVHSPQTPVYLANINADNQVVIAGSDAAMQASPHASKAPAGQAPGGERAVALRAAG